MVKELLDLAGMLDWSPLWISLKTGVAGARIDDRSQPELVDAVESLEQWMSYDVVEKSTWNLDESEYGIVDDFCFVHGLEVSGVGM